MAEMTGGGSETVIPTDALFCGVGFGFSVVDVTVAVSEITSVPDTVEALTVFVTVNIAEAP